MLSRWSDVLAYTGNLIRFKSIAIFCSTSGFTMYNKSQLSLTHKQLKVGTANQRHPLSLAANLLSTI